MIYYKVVNNSRESITVRNRKYRKIYEKGKIIRSDPNTLGIFCFENVEDAMRFACDDDIILKVKSIGRKKKPLRILHWESICEKYLDLFYSDEENSDLFDVVFPPKGTVCYPEVEVLE